MSEHSRTLLEILRAHDNRAEVIKALDEAKHAPRERRDALRRAGIHDRKLAEAALKQVALPAIRAWATPNWSRR